MIVVSELKLKGLEILHTHLGMVETERFIALIQREPFDYTEWRQHLFEGLSGEDICRRAMAYVKSLEQ